MGSKQYYVSIMFLLRTLSNVAELNFNVMRGCLDLEVFSMFSFCHKYFVAPGSRENEKRKQVIDDSGC